MKTALKILLGLGTLLTLATPALAVDNAVDIQIPKTKVQADPEEVNDIYTKRVIFVEFYVNDQGPINLSNSNSPNKAHFNLNQGQCNQTSSSGENSGTLQFNCLVSGRIILSDFEGTKVNLKDGDIVSYVMFMTDGNGENSQDIASGTAIYDSTKNDGVLVFDQTGVIKSDRELTPEQIDAQEKKQAIIDKILDTGEGPATSAEVFEAAKASQQANEKLQPGYQKPTGGLTVRGSNALYAGMSNISAGCDPAKKQISTAVGCIEATPVGLAQAAINVALGIAGGLAFLLMVFGSFRMIASGGNPDSLQQGKQILTAAVAGLLVIIFSVFILRFAGVAVLGLPGLKSANETQGGGVKSNASQTR